MRSLSYVKGTLVLIAAAILVTLVSLTGRAGMVMIIALLSLSGLALLFSIVRQLKDAFIRPARRLYHKDFSLRFMATLMGFFLIVGSLFYFYIFYTIAEETASGESYLGHEVKFSNAEYLLRSFICSLDLFMLDVDSNILDRLDGHAALKGWISVQAVMSFACTVAMLVGLVYSRLVAYLRLNYSIRVSDSRNHLYLFFGNNDPSVLLAKDIVKCDPKAIVIIIDEANVAEDESDEWKGIVGLITHKHRIFTEAERIGAHVTVASMQLSDIDREIVSRPDFDAFGYLGITAVRRLIENVAATSAGPELHIFFMGNDEETNIRNILTLAKDRTVREIAATEKVGHTIYCHARHNGPNRVIRDLAVRKHLNVKIVDSSHIAVERLKMNPECHPVRVMKMSRRNPATVESPFHAMIIGFGEVGRDAFRFLYEFAAVPGAATTDSCSVRVPFDCTIVDHNLDSIKGPFKSAMPAIFEHREATNKVHFHSIDYNSEDFFAGILTDDYLRKLNYVVISIGNNDEAIALAARIFSLVRRLRDDLSDLRIFVRCTDDRKVEGVTKVANHYNYGYGEGWDNTKVIRVFGQPEKTYTYDLVISDRIVRKARIFHEEYRTLSGEGPTWESRHSSIVRIDPPSIDKLRKLRRQESQDVANALNAATKIYILEQALGKDTDWQSFYLRYFRPDGKPDVTGSMDQIRYPALSDKENRVILHLAMLEHLRWNAAHELMGYRINTEKDECDERTLRHNCLCDWQQLDVVSRRIKGWECDYKKYDFSVVDVTIRLARKELTGTE